MKAQRLKKKLSKGSKDFGAKVPDDRGLGRLAKVLGHGDVFKDDSRGVTVMTKLGNTDVPVSYPDEFEATVGLLALLDDTDNLARYGQPFSDRSAIGRMARSFVDGLAYKSEAGYIHVIARIDGKKIPLHYQNEHDATVGLLSLLEDKNCQALLQKHEEKSADAVVNNQRQQRGLAWIVAMLGALVPACLVTVAWYQRYGVSSALWAGLGVYGLVAFLTWNVTEYLSRETHPVYGKRLRDDRGVGGTAKVMGQGPVYYGRKTRQFTVKGTKQVPMSYTSESEAMGGLYKAMNRRLQASHHDAKVQKTIRHETQVNEPSTLQGRTILLVGASLSVASSVVILVALTLGYRYATTRLWLQVGFGRVLPLMLLFGMTAVVVRYTITALAEAWTDRAALNAELKTLMSLVWSRIATSTLVQEIVVSAVIAIPIATLERALYGFHTLFSLRSYFIAFACSSLTLEIISRTKKEALAMRDFLVAFLVSAVLLLTVFHRH